MRLCIPPLESKWALTKDWRFELFQEDRNIDLLALIPGFKRYNINMRASVMHEVDDSFDFTLPTGTILKVLRIYIRKGQEDFNSLTFSILDCPDKSIKTFKEWSGEPGTAIQTRRKVKRFWAKLRDVNKLEVERILT